jgi:phenylalanyl-tRNA synthetase beta chain
MLFSYNWLQSFFERRLPSPEKLADLLSRHFAEVEEIRKENKDFVLDIDVRPNRAPDCFSHLGVVREISAITGFAYQSPEEKIREDKELKAKDFIIVEVKPRQTLARYTARVVTDVKVGVSPEWLQERLKVCGLRPINNIVDIANYVMLETGQPLHTFDFDKIEADKRRYQRRLTRKIIVRFAKKGEKIKTLDEEEYELDNDILVIADSKEPLAIAGIKGGEKAEITNQTKTVVLEAANFNQKIIRRGSRKIDLKTDASWRFEHGIDPNLTEMAINRAAGLIQEIAHPLSGYPRICQELVDFYPKKVLPRKIKLDLGYVNGLLGVKIPPKEIKNILKRLGLKIEHPFHGYPKLEILNVVVPTFRPDISIPEDLIEEIGRIYGYEKISPKFPISALIPPKRNLEIFWEDMTKDILKEAGFTEVYNYSFISNLQLTTYIIELENPTSADFQYLRPSLIPNLLKNVATNQKFFKEIKIFELGKIFVNRSNAVTEKRMLTGVMTVPSEDKDSAFFEVKGVVDSLLNKMGISNIYYDDYQPTPENSKILVWHPRKCAEIKIDGEEIGFLGEISQKILEALKIEGKVVVFDLDFEKLQKIASAEHEYQPISKYPAAIRDLAILVPQEIRVAEVLNKIYDAGGNLIRDVDLFDIYEGEEIPEGKKNLAFHIIYQSADKTLSSKEIDEIQEKIIKACQEEPEWEVRK